MLNGPDTRVLGLCDGGAHKQNALTPLPLVVTRSWADSEMCVRSHPAGLPNCEVFAQATATPVGQGLLIKSDNCSEFHSTPLMKIW